MAAQHELEIVARYKDLASKSVKKLGTTVEKTATKAATGMRVIGSAAKKMGQRIGSAAAFAKAKLAGIIGELKLLATALSVVTGAISFKLVGIASDAAETASKFNVLFGAVEGSANSVADTIASSFGRAKTDVRDYMATIQALLTPMGLVGEQGLEISQSFAKLAIDMASFANASDEEALTALRSGLSGESEPLRRFGVFLSEARVKAEALTLGLVAVNGELTNQQKVLARVSIIQKDTTIQQGDAIRTADEYEGTMKRLGARVKDLASIYGDKLKVAVLNAIEQMGGIDAITTIVEVGMGTMVETVSRLIPKMGEWAGKLADSINSIGGAAEFINRLSDALDNIFEKLSRVSQLFADMDLGAASTRMRVAQHELMSGDEGALSRLVSFTEDYLNAMTRMGASSERLDKIRERVLLLSEAQDLMLAGFIDTTDPLALTTGKLRELVEEAHALTELFPEGKVEAFDPKPMQDAVSLGFDPLTDAMMGGAVGADALSEAMKAAREAIEKAGVSASGAAPAVAAPSLPNLPNGSLQGPTFIESAEPAKKVNILAQAVANLNDRLGSTGEQLVKITENLILNFGNGLTNAISAMINPLKSGKAAMKEFAASFLADMAAMIAKALLFKAIMSLLGFVSSGGGSGSVGGIDTGLAEGFQGPSIPSGSQSATYGGPAPGFSPMGQSVNVSININAMDGADVDRVLVKQRGTLRNIIHDAMITSPSFRSTMLGATV